MIVRRIVLVRHGRSALGAPNTWLDSDGIRRWRDAYDAAGINPDDVPPAALVERARDAMVIVASDLPRARESAERLARQDRLRTTALLRETNLAIPNWLPMRLPLAVWELVIHAQWGVGILLGVDAPREDRARAVTCAAWLADLTSEASVVIGVTHGAFRRLIARELCAHGWRAGPRSRGYQPWSAWEFSHRIAVRATT